MPSSAWSVCFGRHPARALGRLRSVDAYYYRISLALAMSSSAQNRSALSAAETLFAQALQLFPSKHDDTQPVTDDSPILDSSSGLAARFRQVCRYRLDELGEPQLSPTDAVASWRLEQNTWDLIADLYL